MGITGNQSSGDLIADRRYGYGEAMLAERDFVAAADLFRQVLDRVPDWPPAWFALGDAQEKMVDHAAAISSFARALALAPDDAQGASLRLARLGAAPAAKAMTRSYVATLFDQYADRFDDHLVKALDYRGPEIIVAALQAVCGDRKRPFFFPSVLDIGCGTGLMAKALAPHAGSIDGVDLSPAMVAAAQKTGFYRAVWARDGVEAMADNATSYDLFTAADVLVYIGDLGPLLTQAAAVLTADGLLAFTVQSHDGEGFRLGADLRYHHSEDYILETAARAALAVVHMKPCVTRLDGGTPVSGTVIVLARTGGQP